MTISISHRNATSMGVSPGCKGKAITINCIVPRVLSAPGRRDGSCHVMATHSFNLCLGFEVVTHPLPIDFTLGYAVSNQQRLSQSFLHCRDISVVHLIHISKIFHSITIPSLKMAKPILSRKRDLVYLLYFCTAIPMAFSKFPRYLKLALQVKQESSETLIPNTSCY